MSDFAVDYDAILQAGPQLASGELTAYLMRTLSDAWLSAYGDMPGSSSNVLEFEDRGFRFLFDLTSVLDDPDKADDRVVAAFGVTFLQPHERDAGRIRGHPLSVVPDEINARYDRGHFISHLAGGSLDVNLFPQKREVNRGWSEEGKLFRCMERHAAERPGTFCFARPLYDDPSCCPSLLEYGVLKCDGTLWVNRFANK